MLDIPSEVTKFLQEGDIPKMVAELPQESEILETRPYLISFAKYNHKLCQIKFLAKNKGNEALLTLVDIGTNVYTRADFQKNNIKNHSVSNSGDYKKLYNKLDQGIEIRELFLQNTGRIFYFYIEPERVLYVVAITENHYETDKIKR